LTAKGPEIKIEEPVKTDSQPVTIERIRAVHALRKTEIRKRLSEFNAIWRSGSDADIWAEMVFCFFTGGCSARMGLRSLDAVRPLLGKGGRDELAAALNGVHRYPNARARYVAESRSFLQENCGMRLREALSSFDCPQARRDWLAREKGIKGLGYKEASHFLRNVGFRGYAILDKHVLRCLAELGIVETPEPPKNRASYLEAEQRFGSLASETGVDFDELDLVLWSMKTGEILK
jgi:N-glycosylase/DNA lyase